MNRIGEGRKAHLSVEIEIDNEIEREEVTALSSPGREPLRKRGSRN